MEKDYSQMLCQAVEYLVDAKLENIAYDTTILCIVEDDSRASEGIYVVSYGSTKYEAISKDIKYSIGDNVYVQIPQGDWNQQKNIISKKAIANAEPVTYIDPFDNFADITSNLISENQQSSYGLIAEDPGSNWTGERIKEIKIGYLTDSGERDDKYEKNEYQYLGKIPNSIDYTRLGLSADFQSLLSYFQPISGDYGLRVKLTLTPKGGKGESQEITLLLSDEHMIGNPYQLEGFTNQERLFNISSFTECSTITRISLEFYQTFETFKDNRGNIIDYNWHLGDPQINPNLFIRNIYIALGYDLETYKGERVKIFTNHTNTYHAIAEPQINDEDTSISTFGLRSDEQDPVVERPEDNHKQINLSWIHQFDNKFREVTSKLTVPYNLIWYRKKIGSGVNSVIAGEDWEELSVQKVEADEDNALISISYEIKDQDVKNYNAKKGEIIREPSFNSTWLIPDVKNKEEQVKAAITWDNGNEMAVSEPLIFTNDKEIVTNRPEHILTALDIYCEDESFGNYAIYRKDGSILNSVDAQKSRKLTLYFRDYSEEEDKILEPAPLTSAEYVEWIIPKNSMITLEGAKGDTFMYPGDPRVEKQFTVNEDDNCYHIYETPLTLYNSLNYTIKGNINSRLFGNNTIQAKIIKNGLEYSAYLNMTFLVAGTTGTDFTFLLDFEEDSETALSINKNNELIAGDEYIRTVARLYDYSGRDITEKYRNEINWFWNLSSYNGDNAENSITIKKVANKAELSIKLKEDGTPVLTSVPKDNYHILKASIMMTKSENASADDQKYELAAYLPIPIRLNYEDDYLQGVTEVRYNSLGYLDDMSYHQNPYQIFDSAGNVKEEELKWEVYNPEEKEISDGTQEEYFDIINSAKGEINTLKKQIKMLELAEEDFFKPSNNELKEKIKEVIENFQIFKRFEIDEIFNFSKDEDFNDFEKKVLELEEAFVKLEEDESAAGLKDLFNEIKDKYEEYKKMILNKLEDNKKELNKQNDTIDEYTILLNQKMYVNYLPHVDVNNYFVPTSFYVESYESKEGASKDEEDKNNIYKRISVYGGTIKEVNGKKQIDIILWSQPIYIYQYKYPSTLLDKWDGNLKIDEGNNAILASKMAAGRKETDNTFSGVIMGDWGEPDVEESYKTGLYGFHHGTSSFGFKNDGTAFIGKSGHGRLEFDGNESTIKSASYDEPNKGGMKLDFDDGLIRMETYNEKNKLYKVILDSKATLVDNFLPFRDDTLKTAEDYLNQYNMNSPLNVNNNFKVFWDGTLMAKNGIFNGGTIYMENPNKEGYSESSSTGGFTPSANPETIPYAITLDSNAKWSEDEKSNQPPFTIGDNFKVYWDGVLKAQMPIFQNPNLSGAINGEEGSFSTLEGDKLLINNSNATFIEGALEPNLTSNAIKFYKTFSVVYRLHCFRNGSWEEVYQNDKYTIEGLSNNSGEFQDEYDYSYIIDSTGNFKEDFDTKDLPNLDECIVSYDGVKQETDKLAWFLQELRLSPETNGNPIGLVGLVPGTSGGGNVTYNIGIQAKNSNSNIVIEGDKTAGEETWIRIGNADKTDHLIVSCPAENQSGIYARFA